jgi:hypothetical protein
MRRRGGASACVAAIAPLCLSALLSGAFTPRAHADTPAVPGPAPTAVERADDLVWKATGSLYVLPDEAWVDLNVRRQLGSFAAWLGLFHDPSTETAARVGVEYAYRGGPVLVVPSVQVATNNALAAQLYSEIGRETYLIAGVSRTNLQPFFNLSWDPNESVQLGLGHRMGRYDKLYAFTIFDVRLHTGQQDTHVLYRHRVTRKLGVTVDGLWKSGRGDSGPWVRALGIGFYVDGTRWLAKAYYDPHANFSDYTMYRFALGAKF